MSILIFTDGEFSCKFPNKALSQNVVHRAAVTERFCLHGVCVCVCWCQSYKQGGVTLPEEAAKRLKVSFVVV